MVPPSRQGIENIQRDMMKYGSVTAAFSVFSDFLTYSGGVYTHESGKRVSSKCRVALTRCAARERLQESLRTVTRNRSRRRYTLLPTTDMPCQNQEYKKQTITTHPNTSSFDDTWLAGAHYGGMVHETPLRFFLCTAEERSRTFQIQNFSGVL